MSSRILFVCSGNICRSPFAEGYLRKLLADEGRNGFAVSSAGTLRIRDRPASSLARATALEHGVDLGAHRSRGLGAGTLKLHDMVVVMERDHLRTIRDSFPDAERKARLLRDYDAVEGIGRDVFDPIGLSEADYRTCFATIARCVDTLARTLEPPS